MSVKKLFAHVYQMAFALEPLAAVRDDGVADNDQGGGGGGGGGGDDGGGSDHVDVQGEDDGSASSDEPDNGDDDDGDHGEATLRRRGDSASGVERTRT